MHTSYARVTLAEVRRTATRITENLTSFEFIVLLILWEQILRCIYGVSKHLQSKSVNLSTATKKRSC